MNKLTNNGWQRKKIEIAAKDNKVKWTNVFNGVAKLTKECEGNNKTY